MGPHEPRAHGNHDLWVKCITSAECKTGILAVLTVMSKLGSSHGIYDLAYVNLRLVGYGKCWWMPVEVKEDC